MSVDKMVSAQPLKICQCDYMLGLRRYEMGLQEQFLMQVDIVSAGNMIKSPLCMIRV